MPPLYKEFLKYLELEDKLKCIEFALSKLTKNEIDIVTLYNKVFVPSLNKMECKGSESYCIWKEHVRSSIIRSVMENCYPFIEKERKKKYGGRSGEKVIVLCPTEELHEIGARMVADFFTLCGYDVTFIGANTPKHSFLSAIDDVKPKYIAISITNYYNLVAAQKIISEIRAGKHGKTRIIVGGHAFLNNPKVYKEIGADLLVQTFEEIKALRGGD
jgi:methanogenic corrinoid protein MtbC1